MSEAAAAAASHGISRTQWRTLIAAQLGWMLDGMDVMLYAFALSAIRQEFGLSGMMAGLLASVTLLTSAAGGIVAGVLADRCGRRPVLMGSILLYSLCTGAVATAHSLPELLLWRSLVGIGLGAEWSAGSVLVAESWPARHRAKAAGLVQSGWAIGYIAAALLAAAVIPHFGWRPLFAIGALPALLVFWIRRNVDESPVWVRGRAGGAGGRRAWRGLFARELRGRVILASALSACLMFAYWGLFTWIPTYLAAPVAAGGVGLGLVRSTGWVVAMQSGAFLGYTLFGVMADSLGRRPAFFLFVLGAAAITPAFALLGGYPGVLLWLSPLVGFFGHGYFSVFGALLAELFPNGIRATAQGACYNAGRALSAAAPATLGFLAEREGLGPTLAVTSLFFLAAAVLMARLPETRGQELE